MTHSRLNAGKYLPAVLHALKISAATLHRWRTGYRRAAVVAAGRSPKETKRLKAIVAVLTLEVVPLKGASQNRRCSLHTR